MPETTAKKGSDYPVGPILLGFFIFVVIGSCEFLFFIFIYFSDFPNSRLIFPCEDNLDLRNIFWVFFFIFIFIFFIEKKLNVSW